MDCVACVVCARKDWLERRFTVHLWRTASGSTSIAELQHGAHGKSEWLTNGEHLCFGNRDLIDKFLNTKHYCEKFPLIPQDHLYASSVLHPNDEGMSWLLHTRRVPMVPDSRRVPQNSAEQPVSQHKCAGVGDIDAVAHICYDCADCLCVDDKFITMPRFALSNAMWLDRQHVALS